MWGVYYGILLILEKFVFKKLVDVLPKFIGRIFTVFLVIIGWVFFFSPSIGSAFTWLGRMFGIGGPGFLDATAKYYLSGSWIILLIAAVAAYPIGTKLGNNVYRKGNTPVYLSVIWFAALLVLCIAGMMTSTYTTFLYFQF